MPGNVVEPVTPADEAVTNVSASHLTIFGLVSLFFYKLCAKKKQIKENEAEVWEQKQYLSFTLSDKIIFNLFYIL